MVNFRICGIAAGAAFILSLLLGVVSGTRFPDSLLRALVFGALFFALFCVIFWLVAQFVPDLLSGADDGLDAPAAPGAGVSAASSPGQVSGAFPSDDISDDVDSIEGGPSRAGGSAPDGNAGDASFAAGGLDQEAKEGYTTRGGDDGQAPPEFSGDGMPDFDALSAAFVQNSGSGETDSDTDLESLLGGADSKKRSGSRKDALSGDFNAKELAQAIQTVLKKDEKK